MDLVNRRLQQFTATHRTTLGKVTDILQQRTLLGSTPGEHTVVAQIEIGIDGYQDEQHQTEEPIYTRRTPPRLIHIDGPLIGSGCPLVRIHRGLDLNIIGTRRQRHQLQTQTAALIHEGIRLETGIDMPLVVQSRDTNPIIGMLRTEVIQGREHQRQGVLVVVHIDLLRT